MSKLLIIMYDYFPEPSANTFCIDEIINQFILAGSYINVVTLRPKLHSKSREIIHDKLKITRIFILIDYINRKVMSMQNKLFKRLFYKFKKIISNNKIGGYTDFFYSRRTMNVCTKILKNEKIDTMISFSFPFSCHLIANNLVKKFPYLKWVAYEYDPYTYNYTLGKSNEQKRRYIESTTLKNADAIISTEGIINKNNEMNFRGDLLYKNIEVPINNLKIQKISNQDSIKDKTIFVYVGVFYNEFRNPQKLINILHDDKMSDIEFHIYGDNDSKVFDDITLPKNVFLHKRINKEEVNKVLSDADVLVNFGNKMTNQYPSKLFEYMGYGKPIINFYYNSSDLLRNYIINYPYLLNISNYDENNDKIICLIDEFCTKHKGLRLTTEQLSSILFKYLSETVSKNVVDKIRNLRKTNND